MSYLPAPLRWCGVEHPHIAHGYAEPSTAVGVWLSCPGSAGRNVVTTTPLKPEYPPGTVCVRLDGLADEIAARLHDQQCDAPDGCEHDPGEIDAHDARAVVDLLQSL